MSKIKTKKTLCLSPPFLSQIICHCHVMRMRKQPYGEELSARALCGKVLSKELRPQANSHVGFYLGSKSSTLVKLRCQQPWPTLRDPVFESPT